MDIDCIDERLVRIAFNRSAHCYDQAAVIQRNIGDKLLKKLEHIHVDPNVIMDLGCGTGFAAVELHKRFPQALLIGLDLSLSMLFKARHRSEQLLCVCGTAERLPVRAKTIDLVYSNVMLQWCNYYWTVLQTIQQTLTPQGVLLFSTFGPNTLKELRWAWSKVDSYTHVNTFPSLDDLRSWLKHAGFTDLLMDCEILTPNYSTVLNLMQDLKVLGAHNITRQRAKGLTGKHRLAAMISSYEQLRTDGILPVTYEVIYGVARNP